MKRLSALMAVWLCLLCFTLPARAEWPARPVKLLVPLPPGGTADSLARILAEKLALIWNKPVVVENRAGASGIIGAEVVARSAPDARYRTPSSIPGCRTTPNAISRRWRG